MNIWVHVSFNYGFVHIYAQKCDCRIIIWQLSLVFLGNLRAAFHNGCTSLHSTPPPTVQKVPFSPHIPAIYLYLPFDSGHSDCVSAILYPYCSFDFALLYVKRCWVMLLVFIAQVWFKFFLTSLRVTFNNDLEAVLSECLSLGDRHFSHYFKNLMEQFCFGIKL